MAIILTIVEEWGGGGKFENFLSNNVLLLTVWLGLKQWAYPRHIQAKAWSIDQLEPW